MDYFNCLSFILSSYFSNNIHITQHCTHTKTHHQKTKNKKHQQRIAIVGTLVNHTYIFFSPFLVVSVRCVVLPFLPTDKMELVLVSVIQSTELVGQFKRYTNYNSSPSQLIYGLRYENVTGLFTQPDWIKSNVCARRTATSFVIFDRYWMKLALIQL